MQTMRKKSRYRPKGVLLDPLNHVLSGMKRVGSISAGTDLMIKNHSALDAVRRGEATRDDIDVLIAALNMTEALALMRIGQDWKDEIRAAQDALFAVGSRGAETGKFILRGPELTSLNLGMEIHDAQLEVCTVAELERAIDMVHKTIVSNKARPIVSRKEKP
jgi:uncharacterized small protein (DUF1192 family)